MNILIIDDNPTNLLLLTKLIERFDGCRSHSFEAAAPALAWLEAETADLVVVDYMMPEIDGIAFIHRFRQTAGTTEVPIVMVTAADQREVRRRALEAGATDFLAKPVDHIEFRARIGNLLALRQAHNRLRDHAAWLADEVTRATADIREREEETILRLSRTAEYRDPETGSHIERMAHYSRLIAARLGLSWSDQDLVFRAAPMHDIGKVGIPDHILLKPGRLDAQEWAVMKTHTTIGHTILMGSSAPLICAAAEIALTHHEKYDGSGYPNGTEGEAIPLMGRIVAVADVFDALTSVRPYKPAWTLEEARTLLLERRGRHFDPACVAAFLDSWDEVLEIRGRFPPGTRDSER